MGEQLLPALTLSEFRKILSRLKPEDLKGLKSFEVTSNGDYLCTVIIPRTDFIKQQSLYNGQLSNATGGIDPHIQLRSEEAA